MKISNLFSVCVAPLPRYEMKSLNRLRIYQPREFLTPDQALNLAAWLVTLAEPYTETKFSDLLEAVKNENI